MNVGDLNQYKKIYNLNPEEIACIMLWFVVENKTIAFSYTIGMLSKSKHKDVLATRFFSAQNVQQFINDNKHSFLNNNIEVGKIFEVRTEQTGTVSKQQDESISSENIKERLELELSKITDPDKRAVILMKIADFVGLKNSDQDDPLTPTIYLPARCSQCNHMKNNSL